MEFDFLYRLSSRVTHSCIIAKFY